MFKEQCHYSKTGWAWSNETDGCSCRECQKPQSLDEILPAQRELWKDLFDDNAEVM